MIPVHSQRAEEVLPEIQRCLDHWHGGLCATGGALVPHKSYWYLIDFYWAGNKWNYSPIQDCPGGIQINKIDSANRVTLEHLEPEDAGETLGIFLSMTGDNS